MNLEEENKLLRKTLEECRKYIDESEYHSLIIFTDEGWECLYKFRRHLHKILGIKNGRSK